MKSLLEVEHSKMVQQLSKPGAEILIAMIPSQADLLHMAIGISGEAGELLDAVKKNAIYQKEIDRRNVIEELGDLEYYMEGLRKNLGITRNETLDANITKLRARYGDKYSDKSAQERKDKSLFNCNHEDSAGNFCILVKKHVGMHTDGITEWL